MLVFRKFEEPFYAGLIGSGLALEKDRITPDP
jgi:hypothetical protein